MRPSGHPSLREFSIADPQAGPYGITTGADGALWLTLIHSGEIARLTVSGEVSRYPAGPATCRPATITSGPDGALWAALETGGVARLIP
jgi:virginiamycin B lyase